MISKKEQITQKLQAITVSVGSILENQQLDIPHYQRPYKWKQRHVAQLMEDVKHFSDRSTYRLGSLVIHKNEENDNKLEIVDGQQRTITLVLIIKAFMQHVPKPENLKLRNWLNKLNDELFNPVLEHPISQKNVFDNYRFIEQRIHNLDEGTVLFLLEKCEFVQFTLHNLSTAFQFFDSQNARGKDLEPHDLLKAFHLRAFSKNDENVKESVIEKWESTGTKEIAGLFQYYLFRIRSWSNYQSARFFTKSRVNLFKGIDLDHSRQWPFTQMTRIADVHIKTYNQSQDRELDDQKMKFPFQLELPVVNGRLFFEMVSHYLQISEEMWKETKEHLKEGSSAEKVVHVIDNYQGKQRDGDKYIRQLFDAALMQYIDKFGFEEIDSVINHLFVWSYRLRLEKQRVQLASMDNHAFADKSLLHITKKALRPKDVINTPFPMHIELRYTNTRELQKIMKELLGEKIFENA